MRHPQVLVYETDGRIAALLKTAIQANDYPWSLRELSRTAACLRLLRRGGPNVVILKVQRRQVRDLTTLEDLTTTYPKLANPRRYLARQLALVQRIHWLLPDTATLVVGDAEDAPLAALAWDLGASYVLFAPQVREQLVDVVAGLLKAEGGRTGR